MNCGAALAGEYCAACGQRHEAHVHTLGHFLGEAFESITHADSRLWRTLGYLLVKPGRLTREFLDGRRARYLPPFRLYLVISLAFFLIAGKPGFLDDDSQSEDSSERIAGLYKAADELQAQAQNNPAMAPVAEQLRASAKREQERVEKLKASGADAATIERETGDKIEIGGCAKFEPNVPNASRGYQVIHGFCQKMSHTSAREFLATIMHNVPRAMFVFLAFSIVALLTSIPVVGPHLGLLDGLIWLYMIWYIFRAMRVYYGQSRLLTTAKYLAIGFSYLVTSVLVLGLTAVYSALTI